MPRFYTNSLTATHIRNPADFDITVLYLRDSRATTAALSSIDPTIDQSARFGSTTVVAAPSQLASTLYTTTRNENNAQEEGGGATQSTALEEVTRTGKLMLRSKAITDWISMDMGGYVSGGEWSEIGKDKALTLANTDYKDLIDDYETAIREAEKAGCTEESVAEAKASVKAPRDISNSAGIYYAIAEKELMKEQKALEQEKRC